MSRIRVGISGWTYAPWRGVFYPPGLRQADELRFASQAFASIEINGSFYSLMRPDNYRTWAEAAPPDFQFAVKGGRYITHMKRLRDARQGLANFFASGVLALGEKLGPFLWQLPPSLKFDAGVLREFLQLLPRSTREIEDLARGHDARLAGRALASRRGPACRVRHALEVRHESFSDPRYLELLREFGVASCAADSAGLYPLIDEQTTDFAYVRLHGAERLYVSGYDPPALRAWAERVRRYAERGDVYVYFDNDVKVRAPFDAENLTRILGGQRPKPLPKSLASVTEEPRSTWEAWRPRAASPSAPRRGLP